MTAAAVHAVSVAIMRGAILKTSTHTVGRYHTALGSCGWCCLDLRGQPVDYHEQHAVTVERPWGLDRDVVYEPDESAYGAAAAFVAAVGVEAALAAVERAADRHAPKTVPKVTAFMQNENGGRRRSFHVGPFKVMVEPHEDDEAQARFTAALAAAAVEVLP